MALPQLTLRTTKGSALTYAEADANFTNLSTGTIRVAVGTTTTTLSLNDTITFSTGTGMTITANSSTKTITFASSGGSSGITSVVSDTAPQLGGNLDVQTFSIVTTSSNRSITLSPNGSGLVVLNTAELRVGDVDAAAYITSQGAGNLVLGTNYSAGTSSYITINHGVSANIDLNPSGIGDVNVNADRLRVGDSGAQAEITTNGAGDLVLSTNSGTNSGSITIGNGTNGNIVIEPNGTGDVHLVTDALRVGDLNTEARISTYGTGNLVLTTNEGNDPDPTITIGNGANGAITIASTGSGNINLTTATGSVVIAGTTWPSSKGTNGYLLQTNGSGTASWVSTSTLGIPAAYTLTTATAAALGGVKIGSGLSAAVDGTISVSAIPSTGVNSISFGSTGLLPSSATTGTVTVSGVLTVAAGGTNTSEIPVNGQVLIAGNSSYLPRFLTAGSGVTITTATNSITIAAATPTITVYTGGSVSSSITPNFNSGSIQTYTFGSSITINTVTNMTTGSTISLILSQDATGNRVATWSDAYYFTGGTATSVLSTASNAIDRVDITYVGNKYLARIDKSFIQVNPPITTGVNTRILMRFENNLTDSSGLGSTWTMSANGGYNATAKAGSYSLDDVAQTGQDKYCYSADTTKWEIGTGDFTIEAWVYNTSNSGGYYHPIFDCRPSANGSGGQKVGFVLWYGGSGTVEIGYTGGGSGYSSIFGGTVGINAWVHVAYVRSGSSGSLYVNGSRVNTQTESKNIGYQVGWTTPTRNAAIGRMIDGAQNTSHYIDELRLSNVARYSGATYTIPSAPFALD